MLNMGYIGVGAVTSAAQETSLPVILNVLLLAVIEVYKYKRSKQQSKKCKNCDSN